MSDTGSGDDTGIGGSGTGGTGTGSTSPYAVSRGVVWRGRPGDGAGAAIALADLDQDGQLEILATAPSREVSYYHPINQDNHREVYLLDAPFVGGPINAQAWGRIHEDRADPYYPVSPSFEHLEVVADATGDGIFDLVTTSSAGFVLLAGPLMQEQRMTDRLHATNDPAPSLWRTSCGDLDGNSVTDLCGFSRVFLGPIAAGEASLDQPHADLVGVERTVTTQRIRAGASGRDEILVTDQGRDQVHLLSNLVAGTVDVPTLADATWDAPGDAKLGVGFPAADLDADGHDDIILTHCPVPWTNCNLHLVTQLTGGDVSLVPGRIAGDAHCITPGNFDGDDSPDLAVSRGDRVDIYLGPLASGHHAEDDAAISWVGTLKMGDKFGCGAAAGDLNLDGIDDLVVGAENAHATDGGGYDGEVHLIFRPGIPF